MGPLTNAVQNFMMGKQFKAQQEQQRQQEQANQLLSGLLMGTATPEQTQQLAGINPQMYLMGQEYVQGQQTAQAEKARVLDEERDKQDLMRLQALPYQDRVNYLENRRQEILQKGGDPSDTEWLMSLPEPQLNKAIGMMSQEMGIGGQEGFTLKPGEVRFDANGQPIAMGALKPSDMQEKLVEMGYTPGTPEYFTAARKMEGLYEGDVPELDFKDLRSINNDVTGLTKDTQKITEAASRLAKVSETKSSTDQLAAIFTFMKALDPTSVVREGEQDQARRTGGVTDMFVGYINQIKGQGALPPEVFDEMVRTAQRLGNQAITNTSEQVQGYLKPYGDRIPEKEREDLLSRIPKPFEVMPVYSSDDLNSALQKYGD